MSDRLSDPISDLINIRYDTGSDIEEYRSYSELILQLISDISDHIRSNSSIHIKYDTGSDIRSGNGSDIGSDIRSDIGSHIGTAVESGKSELTSD